MAVSKMTFSAWKSHINSTNITNLKQIIFSAWFGHFQSIFHAGYSLVIWRLWSLSISTQLQNIVQWEIPSSKFFYFTLLHVQSFTIPTLIIIYTNLLHLSCSFTFLLSTRWQIFFLYCQCYIWNDANPFMILDPFHHV